MDKNLRQVVHAAFDEFLEDFLTTCSDIDKDILNYSSKYINNLKDQQVVCMEVTLQLIVHYLSKNLAIFDPKEQIGIIDKIESQLREKTVPMHKAWLKHREKYYKDGDAIELGG